MAPPTEAPPIQRVVNDLLDRLDTYLPDPPSATVPRGTVSLAGLTERSVGVGNWRGTEARARMGLIGLKGGRIEALVRFQVSGSTPTEANAQARDLNTRLLAARQALTEAGILRITLESVPPPAFSPVLGLWGAESDYRILFEYDYEDSEGTESLIARIPIESDLEHALSAAHEVTTVTDELVRWDDAGPAAPLTVRGPRFIGRISALSFVALAQAPPSGSIVVRRAADGVAGPPTDFGSFDAFLDAVAGTGPPNRNARMTFPTLADFLAALGPPEATLRLGDWNLDNVLDGYEPRSRRLEAAIRLPTSGDRLDITYPQGMFDHMAVLYVRLSAI